jgi:hypothetical protein
VGRAGERALDVAGNPAPAQQLLGSAPRIDDRLQRRVLHLDELREVLGLRARLRDHGGHRLARVPDLAVGQDRVRQTDQERILDREHGERPGAARHVERGHHSDKARAHGGRVDRDDVRPRVGAADERGVRDPRKLEVVEVAGSAPQHALVLAPADGLAEEAQARDPPS